MKKTFATVPQGHSPPQDRFVKLAARIFSLVACIFGAVTIAAGARVLLGVDPGYAVYRPLVLFNTFMGAIYVAAGGVIWFNIAHGRWAAAAVFGINAVALVVVATLLSTGEIIALETLKAMAFRTAVWLMLALGLYWITRHIRPSSKLGH